MTIRVEETKLGSQQASRISRLPSPLFWTLFIFWLVASGLCLLLCNTIVNAICHPVIRGA